MRALALLVLTGCGGSVIQRADALPPPPPGVGYVELRCAPHDADVYVDGRYRGRLDGYPGGVIRLPGGPHRVRLHKAGFYAWYGVLEAVPAPAVVQTHLVAEP